MATGARADEATQDAKIFIIDTHSHIKHTHTHTHIFIEASLSVIVLRRGLIMAMFRSLGRLVGGQPESHHEWIQ